MIFPKHNQQLERPALKSLSLVRLFMIPSTVSLPGFSSMGILQARILEWVAMSSPPGDLPNPGIKPRSPSLQADSLPSESSG